MLVSFLKTGSYDGVGTSAVDYLIDEKDHKGDIRPQVVVLRGDPERTAKTIDFLNFSKRYTSFVLAFEKLDNPSVEQMGSVLDDVERMAFAGMEDCELLAVMHKELNGGVHIHVIIPNVCLSNGKSFNPVPPKHEYRYGDLCKAYNYRYSWASPDDPKRARSFAVGKIKNAVNTELHEEITTEISELILSNKITSYNEMVEHLQKSFEVKVKKDRKDSSKTYLLIREFGSPKGEKGIRFEGNIFDKKIYNDIEYLKTLLKPKIKEVTYDLEKSNDFLKKVNNYIKKRALANHELYYPDDLEEPLIEIVNFGRNENYWDFCENKEQLEGQSPEMYIAERMNTDSALISTSEKSKEKEESKKSLFIGSSYRANKEFKRKMFYRLYKTELPLSLDNCYINAQKEFVEINSKKYTLIDYDQRVNVSYNKAEDLVESVSAALDLCLAKGWKLESIEPRGSDEAFNQAVREEIARRLGENEEEEEAGLDM